MNKYEVLFQEILEQTQTQSLLWRQLNRHENSDLIFNANAVVRQFMADFSRGGNRFTLLLVEKKFEESDFGFTYYRLMPEVLVLEDGELVTTLTDTLIERKYLLRLLGMVQVHNDKARKLFDVGAWRGAESAAYFTGKHSSQLNTPVCAS